MEQLFIEDLPRLVGRTIEWSARSSDDEETASGLALIKAYNPAKGVKIETESGDDLIISDLDGQAVQSDPVFGDGFIYYSITESDAERLGKVIREARMAMGLSIREFEEMCGVSRTNISKLERGEYNASISVLSRVLKPLGRKLTIEGINS